MQCVTACILLLALCGPLLVTAKKVVYMVPHQNRRSPTFPPRIQIVPQASTHSKRYYYPSGSKRPYESVPIYYGKAKPYDYDKRNLPHGGDDFDQGHEPVRHIQIPYGKGISHGISYGRGYIPYNKIKSDFTRFKPSSPESRPESGYHHQPNTEPIATSPLYASSSSSQFVPSFPPAGYEYSSEKKTVNNQDKYSGDNAVNPPSAGDYKVYDYKDYKAPSKAQKIVTENKPLSSHGKGIVISDSVLLEDYNKKVEEFTNSWPKIVNFNSNKQAAKFQAPQVSHGLFLGVPVAQGRQSYAVHENVQEHPVTYHHGIVTSPFQLGQTTKNVDVSSLISVQG